MKTNLIIIGSGPGGYHTAVYAAKHGMSVVVIEKSHAGGTCLNRGCIPTKAFCHEAEVIETVKAYTKAQPDIDFAAIKSRKQGIVEQLRGSVEALMAMPGITFVRGEARFKDSKTVCVGTEEYTADHIIIASGSHSRMPNVVGLDNDGVVTSTELLDIEAVPKRLCIIGAGVIGMEFASVFRSFGSEVTVLEYLKECLPMLSSDIAKRLRKSLEQRGISFNMQAAVKSVEKTDTGLVVNYERKGKAQHVEADVVLVATGRGANVEGLGLDAAGVEYDAKGIKVDDDLQTNVPGIYAVGDVNGRIMLAHAAYAQGMKCVDKIIGKEDKIQLGIMPSAIFTNPEAACVGLTEDQCDAKGIDYKSLKSFYRANGKALAVDATDGMVKLLTDASGKIIGCHVYGAHASDLVQEVTAIMNYGGTVDDLRDIIHTHPTLEEILQAAAG